MSDRQTVISTTAALHWDRESLVPQSVMARLSEEAVSELEGRRATLAALYLDLPSNVDAMLPAFAREIDTLKTQRLDGAPGFCIIDGAGLQHFSPAEVRA